MRDEHGGVIDRFGNLVVMRSMDETPREARDPNREGSEVSSDLTFLVD